MSMKIANSLNAHIYHGELLLFDGQQTDRLWRLNFSSFVWHEETCAGLFPPPTRFHATALCGFRLYVSGGELCDFDLTNTTCAPFVHDLLEMYVVDLRNLRWDVVACEWKPRNRLHHTMTALNNGHIIVIGGRPLRDDVTAEELREIIADDFYAVHIFDVALGTWRFFLPSFLPPLWGHSAHVVNSEKILIFGGFETTVEKSENGKEVPTVAINNYLRFLNCTTTECYCVPLGVSGRVFHKSHLRGEKLCVLGGYYVDESCLTLRPKHDAVEISLVSFEVNPINFCLRYWPVYRFVSVVYNQQLIVLNKVEDIFVQRRNGNKTWERYCCNTAHLTMFPFFVYSSTGRELIFGKGEEKEKKDRSRGPLTHVDKFSVKPSVSPLILTILARLEYSLGG